MLDLLLGWLIAVGVLTHVLLAIELLRWWLERRRTARRLTNVSSTGALPELCSYALRVDSNGTVTMVHSLSHQPDDEQWPEYIEEQR